VLTSFDGADGAHPDGMILSGNTFYGTTSGGGSDDIGTAFSLPITGGTPITLVSFNSLNGNSEEEDTPDGLIMDSNGNLYGTTTGPEGTVFELSPMTVPEPTSLGLLAISSLALLRRTRSPALSPSETVSSS